MNNRDLRTTYQSTSYVIVVDRDGVRKYISKDFPRDFAYTIKLDKAKRFHRIEDAEVFIEDFHLDCINPVIHKCIRTFQLGTEVGV